MAFLLADLLPTRIAISSDGDSLLVDAFLDHGSLVIAVRNVVEINCAQRLANEGVLAEWVIRGYGDISVEFRFIPIKNCSVLNVHNAVYFFQI